MNTSPLACDMTVFTPVERESHIQNTLQLYQSVRDIRAVENGYEFLFPHTTEMTKLAEFISKEKMCCPFLEFTLKVEPNKKPISLTLTGPDGTQEFLREEFQDAFA
ncbi:MAG: hypothetical protein HXY35_13950 [Chloroflexi bacterium]|nr:hypothetical protein [Chloroflexota bacterium]